MNHLKIEHKDVLKAKKKTTATTTATTRSPRTNFPTTASFPRIVNVESLSGGDGHARGGAVAVKKEPLIHAEGDLEGEENDETSFMISDEGRLMAATSGGGDRPQSPSAAVKIENCAEIDGEAIVDAGGGGGGGGDDGLPNFYFDSGDDAAFFSAMLKNLQHLVTASMPNAISRYNYEAKLFAEQRHDWIEEQKKKLADGNSEAAAAAPTLPNVNHQAFGVLRKKFFWTRKVRELFNAIVERHLLAVMAETPIDPDLCRERERWRRDAALKNFLSKEINPLWPAGWMTLRALMKAARPMFSKLWSGL